MDRPDPGHVQSLQGWLTGSCATIRPGGVAERTNAAVLKLAAIDVSASDRTICTLKTAALSRCGPVQATACATRLA